jgi:mercuric ion binding protein
MKGDLTMRHHMLIGAAALFMVAAGSAAATGRTVALAVPGMTCALCPPIVRQSLARVPGVSKVEVSAETRRAVVTFDDQAATIAALVKATTNAGYPSRVIQ